MEETKQNLLEQIEKKQIQEKFLWKKPLMINVRKKETVFEDFFKQVHGKFIKVKSIEIIWLQSEYIKGVQFHYLTEDKQVVKGHKMQIYQTGDLKSKTFELQENEYITKIYGRKGLVLDALGFKTNLGRSCYLGGNGGGEFSVEAPEGFHFCVFSGCCGDCNSSLSALLSDIMQIPSENYQVKQNSEILKQKVLPIMRNLMNYLTIEEFLNLFLLNKTFANFRFDHYLLKQLIQRMIYGLDTNQRKYVKLVLQKLDPQIEWVQELNNLYKYTKNIITNSSGSLQGYSSFDGWNTTNGGNGWAIHDVNSRLGNKKCFASSFAWGELKFNKELTQILNAAQYKDLINEDAILVVGGFVGQNGFGLTQQQTFVIIKQEEKQR